MTHPCKWAAVGDASCQGSQPAVPLPFHEDLSHMWEVYCYTYLPCVGTCEVALCQSHIVVCLWHVYCGTLLLLHIGYSSLILELEKSEFLPSY